MHCNTFGVRKGLLHNVTGRYAESLTLVVATRNDAAVPMAHAESLVNAIPRAELVESQADSHLIWFGKDSPAVANKIRSFLLSQP